MIRQVEYKRAKPGLRYDPKRKAWIGWRVDVTIDGRRHRARAFGTKIEAENFLADLRASRRYRHAGLKFESRTMPRLSELIAKRLAMITDRRELLRAERILGGFRTMLEMDPYVTDLRPGHFRQFANLRAASGVSPATIGRDMTVLSSALKAAPVLFPEALDAFEPPKVPRPRISRAKGRQRVITEREKDAIIAAILSGRVRRERYNRSESRATIAAMFELAWLLGLRLGELLKLVPSDFDAEARTLRVVRWKTGAVTRFDHLPERVAAILSEYTRIAGTHIFELRCTVHTMYAVLRDACGDCGIEYGRKAIDGVTFHATRHSFTTRLVQVTDIATAQSFTGHTSPEMINYYSHASDESRRTAMRKLYGDSGRRDKLIGILRDFAAGAMSESEAADAIENTVK